MLHVQCPGCMTQAFLECTCPDGHADVHGDHHGTCPMSDPDAAIACPAGSGCCPEDHDHAAAANACPGEHSDPCPDAADCRVWKGATADVGHPLFTAGSHPLVAGSTRGDCPGGHCHKDIDGCTVCRPLIITVPSGGYTVVQTAGA